MSEKRFKKNWKKKKENNKFLKEVARRKNKTQRRELLQSVEKDEL